MHDSNSFAGNPTTGGSSNAEIVNLTKYISRVIEANGKFVVDYIYTDGDKGLDSLYVSFFTFIENILKTDKHYIEKISDMSSLTHIPIRHPFHLLKNGCSHLINHPMMIDTDTMRIINMTNFEEAANLKKVLNDKSTISSMKFFFHGKHL